MKKINIEKPPGISVYYKFYAEKWDMEYARNVLLYYIKEKGLDSDCDKWLEKHFPEAEYK